MPYEEVLAEMPKVTDNQQESVYLPLADYLNAGIVRPSEEYFRVLPDGTLVPIVEDGVTVILQEVKTVQLYENGNFIVNPDEGYGAIGKVLLEINVPTLDTSDATIVEGDILEGKFGYANGQKVYGNIKNNGSKSVVLDADNTEYSLKGYYSGGSVKITIQNPDPVTPTKETQIVEAEDGKVLGRVTVNPIPNDYLIPDKTLHITANGTYPDIREYREAIVNVPSEIPEGYYKPEGTKVITENNIYDVKTYASVDVRVPGKVLPVYDGDFTVGEDSVTISGKWKIDISKLLVLSEQGQDVNFSIDAGAADGDAFTLMVYTSGSLYYVKENGVQYNVFSYTDYIINHIGWKYDGITGEPSIVYFGEEPQEVSKQWLDWFLSIATEEVEDELSGTWVFNDTVNIPETVQDWDINFQCNGVQYTLLSAHNIQLSMPIVAILYDGANVYEPSSGWYEQYYKTIAITSKLSEVTNGETLLTWLQANATKQ